MKSFIKLVFKSIVSTLVSIAVVVLVVVGVVWALTRGGVEVEDQSWVVVDFYGDVQEYDPPGSPLAMVMGAIPSRFSISWTVSTRRPWTSVSKASSCTSRAPTPPAGPSCRKSATRPIACRRRANPCTPGPTP